MYIPHACSSIKRDSIDAAGEESNEAGPSGKGRHVIALDMSSGLLDIAKGQLDYGAECVRGELGFEGWRRGVFVSRPLFL